MMEEAREAAPENTLTRKANATNPASPVFLSPKSGVTESGITREPTDNDKSMSFPGLDKGTMKPSGGGGASVGDRLYADGARFAQNRKSAIEKASTALDKELLQKVSSSNKAYDSLSARASK